MAGPRILIQCAVSADGFIARRDGSVDWLPAPDPEGPGGDYGMGAFMARVGTIVWGRRTFDQSLGFGPLDAYGPVRHVVLTHRPPPSPLPKAPGGLEFVSEPATTLARRLRTAGGRDVWLMGGAEVHAAYLAAGEVDEVMLHVIPTLLGDGIPLAKPHPSVAMRLRETIAYPDGVVRLHYDVTRTEVRRG